jgi:type IV pilus secretin PilQ/predicted competence protein
MTRNSLRRRAWPLVALIAVGIAHADDMTAPLRTQDKPSQGGARPQNFNFQNTDIRAAFKAISVTGKVDIVISPAIGSEVVNLQLTDKTWQEAMLILCQMFNLKYLVEDSYLYVQTMAEFNKTSVENAQAMQQSGSLAPLMRDIIKLRNAKAKDLEPSIKGLLSPRGRINIVERNNALLIFDTRSNILEIRAAIRDLDVETYQVNIQAQLIEVDADALREMGVDWQFGYGQINLAQLRDGAGKLPQPSVGNVNLLGTSNPGGLSSSSSSSSGSGSDGSGSSSGSSSGVGGVAGATAQFAFGLLDGNLAIAVANLLRTARGEILARPQITTLDNTEARIFMGEQVPIRVLDENGRQALQLQDAGTSLQVTPHVTADGRVLLDLQPEKNSFRVDQAAGGVILQKQNAKTNVLVNDGETVVIAGLTTKEETEAESGIPLLKDIPVLGWLFKHKAVLTRKRDLIIFVTPRIVATNTPKNGAASYDFKPLSGAGVYGETGLPDASKPGPGNSENAAQNKSGAPEKPAENRPSNSLP